MSFANLPKGLKPCATSSTKLPFVEIQRSRFLSTTAEASARASVAIARDKYGSIGVGNYNMMPQSGPSVPVDGDMAYSTDVEDIIFGYDELTDSGRLHMNYNDEDGIGVPGDVRFLQDVSISLDLGTNTNPEDDTASKVESAKEEIYGCCDVRSLYELFDLSGHKTDEENREILQLTPRFEEQIDQVPLEIQHPRLQELQSLLRRSLLALCRSYGLSLKGTKKELARRIWKYEQSGGCVHAHRVSAIEVLNDLA